MHIFKNWILGFGIKKLAIISTVAVVGVTGTTVGITSVKKSENAVVEEEKIVINTQKDEKKEAEVEKDEEVTEEVANQEVVTEATSEEAETETVKEQTSANTTNSENSNTGSATTNTNSNSSTTKSEDSKPSKVTTSDGNTNADTQTATPTYERFTSAIGVYETKNLPSEDSYYDDRCPAWIGVYSIGRDDEIISDIKERFKEKFGYTANSDVVCSCVGTYYVDGYDTVKDVYQYTIKDMTYPLLTDEFYVIKKELCTDGSAWVGFPVPGNIDTMDTSMRVSDLLDEMNQMFCEWTGYSMDYVYSNHGTKFRVNMISEAGKMRTLDGQVLELVYRYTRGVNMPVNAE